MKSINPALLTHIASGTTTLCTIIKLTRRDGVVMGFTDHDRDLVVGDVIYEAAIGHSRSATKATADLAIPNMQVAGIIDSAGLSDADLRAGVYDFARIEINVVNWADLTMGDLRLSSWRLGQVQVIDHGYSAEILGMAQAFTKQIIRPYTPDCDADLGDSRCGVNLPAFTETGTVAAVSNPTRIFTATISGSRPDGFFDGGLVTWTFGANLGYPPLEVKSVVSGTVTLYLPTNAVIAVGNTFSISAGCNKAMTTCQGKFANIANFRGFPFIPGIDAVIETPNAL